MAYFHIPPPDPLELTDGSAATNWRNWSAAWSNYTLATKLDKEDEERQVATLLAVIGKEANKVFRTFTWADPADSQKVTLVLKQFEDYCIPRQNVTYERFRFFTRDQGATESVDQYVTDLRQIAANCDLGLFNAGAATQRPSCHRHSRYYCATKAAPPGKTYSRPSFASYPCC